jgi:hypothetical protein
VILTNQEVFGRTLLGFAVPAALEPLFKKRVAEHLLDVRRLFPWVCSAKIIGSVVK